MDHEYQIRDFYITLQAWSCSIQFIENQSENLRLRPGDDASPFNKKWSSCYKKSQEADSFIGKKKGELLLTWTLKRTWLFSNQITGLMIFISVRKSHFWRCSAYLWPYKHIDVRTLYTQSSQYVCRYYLCTG